MERKWVKVPWLQFLSMIVFILFLSLASNFDWPMGPMGLDWGVWLVCYVAYAALIIWSIVYVTRANRGDNDD
ncbi:MAG: hypothetical protein ACM3WU_03235 [Bacillota bacterium]